MSRLYGVTSHAILCRLLKAYKKRPFCRCCRRRRYRPSNQDNVELDVEAQLNTTLFTFLQENHLSVLDVEKKLNSEGLCGRVDCIFLQNTNDKKTIYIVDWKFTRNLSRTLAIDHVIQLNLYRYIMQRMPKYNNYDMQLYCIRFSSSQSGCLEISKSKLLPDTFIRNLITKTIFHSK